MLPAVSPEDSELVLEDDRIDVRAVDVLCGFEVGLAVVLADGADDFGRVRVALAVVDGHDGGGHRLLSLTGSLLDAVGDVLGEGRNAALARRVVSDEDEVHPLSFKYTLPAYAK